MKNLELREELFNSIKDPSTLDTESKRMYLAIELAKRLDSELSIAMEVFKKKDAKEIDAQFDLIWHAYQVPERMRFYNQR